MNIIWLQLDVELCAGEHAVCGTHTFPRQGAHPLCDVDTGFRLPPLEKLPAWGSGTLRLGLRDSEAGAHRGHVPSPTTGVTDAQIQKTTGVRSAWRLRTEME